MMSELPPHGDIRRYRYHRCHCTKCRAANAAAARKRRQDIAFGRYVPDVDAGPVREHVQSLRASGMWVSTIAAMAGVKKCVVEKLLYNKPPTRKIRARHADKLLAVHPYTATEQAS